MSHHIYTTQGLIISRRPYGEAGKFLLMFTRDQGMIGVVVQGVRLMNSKLRYHIDDYSYSLFSLVRGKDMWRMTGAVPFLEHKIDNSNLRLYARILNLLKRLLHGEEKNERLFSILHEFYDFLSKQRTEKDRESIESLVVLRILYCLGYISNNDLFNDIISINSINEVILDRVRDIKTSIIKEINNALKESQL